MEERMVNGARGVYIVVQAARGPPCPSRHAKPFSVIHRSPDNKSDLNKSTTVCKMGDLEVFPKPSWIWKHIHVHKVHVHEVYAHEVHAYELHAHKVHTHEVQAREVHAP